MRRAFDRPFDFSERYGANSWAFVTGAAGGLGLQFCKSLAQRGINVIIVDKDEKLIESAEKEIKELYPDVQVRVICTDLCKENSVEYYQSLIDQVSDIDVSILINNAGFARAPVFADEDHDSIVDYLEINCVGPTLLSSMFNKKFKNRSKRSAIINMSSQAGILSAPMIFNYSIVKSFLRFFTLGLQEEIKSKVDVLCVCPGFVRTNLTAKLPFKVPMCEPVVTVEKAFTDLGKISQ